MARIETDPNYSSPTFSRATAATDIFKKEDVQALAAALSTHDHSTGKGSRVAFSGPADIPDWIRSTGHPTSIAPATPGAVLYYDGATSGATLLGLNGSAYVPVSVFGDPITLTIGGVGVALTIAHNRSVTVATDLIVSGATTASGALNVGGATGMTGTLTLGTGAHIHPATSSRIEWPGGGYMQDYSGAFLQINNLHIGGALEVIGTGTFSGNLVGSTIYVGTDATRWIQPVASTTNVLYVAGAAGIHVFSQSGGSPAAITASQLTVPNSVYSNGAVINNGTDNKGIYFYVNGGAGGVSGWQTIPSSINFKSGVRTVTEALDVVKDDTLHGVHYLVTPDGFEPFEAFGFLAEPWFLVAPDLVSLDEAGLPQGMDYTQVVPFVFEALKEYVAATDARLAALEAAPA